MSAATWPPPPHALRTATPGALLTPPAPAAVYANLQPGVANGMAASLMKRPPPQPSRCIVGYTGHRRDPDAPKPVAQPGSEVTSYQRGARPDPVAAARKERPYFRIPGYGGHAMGHQHSYGLSYGAIGGRERAQTAAGGCRALISQTRLNEKPRNVQAGYVLPEPKPRAKSGYTGHIAGRHLSENFGKAYAYASLEMIGTGVSGGVGDVGREFIADVDWTKAFPAGHVGRPARHEAPIAGYAGCRPRPFTAPVGVGR